MNRRVNSFFIAQTEKKGRDLLSCLLNSIKSENIAAEKMTIHIADF